MRNVLLRVVAVLVAVGAIAYVLVVAPSLDRGRQVGNLAIYMRPYRQAIDRAIKESGSVPQTLQDALSYMPAGRVTETTGGTTFCTCLWKTATCWSALAEMDAPMVPTMPLFDERTTTPRIAVAGPMLTSSCPTEENIALVESSAPRAN